MDSSLKENARISNKYSEIWKNVNKCVFCDLKEKYILHEINEIVLTTNIYPYIDGHLMLVPRKHIKYLKELTSAEWETIRLMEYIAKKFLRKLFGYKALWIVYREGGSLGKESQKTVEHLHIHLIPYVEGLVQWNYQKIKIPPNNLASIFKENLKFAKSLEERYKSKYI